MIYRNNRLITTIDLILLDADKHLLTKPIGKIYKGGKLVWITIYNAIKSCYGSGTWLSDKNWINDDNWKNN